MKFSLEINMDNAAFKENQEELPDILYLLANTLSIVSPKEGNLRDSNGNTVGEWKIVE